MKQRDRGTGINIKAMLSCIYKANTEGVFSNGTTKQTKEFRKPAAICNFTEIRKHF